MAEVCSGDRRRVVKGAETIPNASSTLICIITLRTRAHGAPRRLRFRSFVSGAYRCSPIFEEKKMENEKNKPVDEIKLGSIVASIWRNESISGSYFNVTVTRLYKDAETWKRSDSFGRDDLLLVSKVLDLSHTRIYQLLSE